MSTQIVDFSNVKDGGQFNRNRVPAGDYLAQVVKVDDAKAKDGVFQYLFSIKLKNQHQSRTFPYYCKLQDNQLWKLRNLLIAGGMTVPKKRMKLDPSRIVGKLIGVTLEDDEYEGREQSEITAVFPAADLTDGATIEDDDDDVSDDLDDDDDLDDEPAPAPKKKSKPAPVVEDDEDDEDEAEEDEDEEEETAKPYANLDRTQLKREIKKIDGSYSVKRSQTDDDLREVLAGLAGGGAAEEDEEDEAPAPKKAAAKRKTKAAKVEDITDDELDELDLDDL